jgi:hypothetical protein
VRSVSRGVAQRRCEVHACELTSTCAEAAPTSKKSCPCIRECLNTRIHARTDVFSLCAHSVTVECICLGDVSSKHTCVGSRASACSDKKMYIGSPRVRRNTLYIPINCKRRIDGSSNAENMRQTHLTSISLTRNTLKPHEVLLPTPWFFSTGVLQG